MKHLFSAFPVIMLLLVCSCSDSDTENLVDKEPVLDHIAFDAPKEEVVIEVEPTLSKQIIGAGYDICAPYLSQKAIKAPIVDLQKMEAQDRYVLMAGTSCYSDVKTFKTVAEIPTIMQSNISDDSWFSPDFAHSSCFSFAYLCTNFQYYIQRVQLMDYVINSRPEKVFTDEFLSDLNTLTPQDIISKYGTHVIAEASTGLRFGSFYRTATFPPQNIGGDKGPSKDLVCLYSAVWAMHKAGLPMNMLVSIPKELDKMHGDGALRVGIAGGNTSLLSANPTNEEIDAWLKEGCTSENAALIAFLEEPRPIYEIIPDKEKAKAIKRAFDQYVSSNTLGMKKTAVLLQSWENGQYKYSTIPISDTEGGLCAIPLAGANGLSVLYAVTEGNKSRLMTGENGVPVPGASLMLGYIYSSQVEGTVPLYEYQYDGYYYYALTDKAAEETRWNKTGILGYVIPLTVSEK